MSDEMERLAREIGEKFCFEDADGNKFDTTAIADFILARESALRDEVKRLEKENERWELLYTEYADHYVSCPAYNDTTFSKECDCGYIKALAPKEKP